MPVEPPDAVVFADAGRRSRKAKYLAAEQSPGALDAMRAIKGALDPLDIMNPGKILSFQG